MVKKWIFLVILVILLVFLRAGLAPLMIGLMIAFVLDPYVDWLVQKLEVNRGICIVIAFFTLLLAVLFLTAGFAQILSGSITNKSWADELEKLTDYLQRYFHLDSSFKGMTKLAQSVGSFVIKFFVGIVISVYLLKDKAFFLRLSDKALRLFFNQNSYRLAKEICGEINEVISSFLRGVFIDSVVVAFLSSAALALLKVDYAVMIGCFAGISNIIPYFGPIIGMIPAVIASLAGGGLSRALMAAAALFLIQQIECNLIYPRIVGKSTGLHPLFVLTAVSVAGYYGGLFSMVLAVPAAGVIKVLLCKWIQLQEQHSE